MDFQILAFALKAGVHTGIMNELARSALDGSHDEGEAIAFREYQRE